MDEKLRALMTRHDALCRQRLALTDKISLTLEEIFAYQKVMEAMARPDYKAYLQSDEWRKRARKARKEAKFRCQLCNASDRVLHVHHRTYENLGHEEPADLVCLCDACHRKFHGITEPEDDRNTLVTA